MTKLEFCDHRGSAKTVVTINMWEIVDGRQADPIGNHPGSFDFSVQSFGVYLE